MKRNLPDYHALPTNIDSVAALITTPCGPAGSGVCVRDLNCFFLVTAYHVLFEDDEEGGHINKCDYVDFHVWLSADNKKTTGRSSRRIDLKNLDRSNIVLLPQHDLAALRIGTVDTMNGLGKISFFKETQSLGIDGTGIISVQHRSNSRALKDIHIGNDAVVVGYPGSLGISNMQFDPQKPLLRKGIVSQVNEQYGSVILDCPTYYGNSGGPALELYKCHENCNKNHFAFIGVVSQFVPFDERQNKLNNQVLNNKPFLTNSGYSVIMPLEKLFDEISNKTEVKLGGKAIAP